MTSDTLPLRDLGWSPVFQAGLDPDELRGRAGARRRGAPQRCRRARAAAGRGASPPVPRCRPRRSPSATGCWLDARRPAAAPARAQVADRPPGRRDRRRVAADRRQPRHAVHRQLVQRRLQPRPARALPSGRPAGRGDAGRRADQGRRLRRPGRLRRPRAGARVGGAARGGERARPGLGRAARGLVRPRRDGGARRARRGSASRR